MLKAAFLLVLTAMAAAAPVTLEDAADAAAWRIARDGMAGLRETAGCATIETADGTLLAWVFDLDPAGYAIVSADDNLPPVVAYSYQDSPSGPAGSWGVTDLARMDLGRRLELLESTPVETVERNRALWAACSDGSPSTLEPLAQWPPEGSTPTGGWLWENWTQGSPYNSYCPMDNIAGSRSVAGCPAVAMGMIVDNLETAMSIYFTDVDDYYHNYHEYYYIDDDYVAHDFPSWTELNSLVDVLESHYESGTPLTNSDKAALVVACGFACKQVFTASVSGTFGVDQAYDAYIRFGFDECELLYESSDSLFEKLSQNMMCANCAHLAIIDEGPNYGHNVVLDGYNTDDFYHINFGWGGSYNGWYQFPLTGMPYQMNIIEGIVLNIGVGMTGVEEDPGTQGGRITLSATMNPTSADPTFVLHLPLACEVRVEVYDISGRLVGIPGEGLVEAGDHMMTWEADAAPPGVYLVRASGPLGGASARITIIR